MVNLISNGTFNNLTGWELILPIGNVGTTIAQNGYASVSITSSPSGINRFLTSGLLLKPNTNYDLNISLGTNPSELSIQPMLLNYNNLSEIVAQSSPIIAQAGGAIYKIKLTTGSIIPVNSCLSFNLTTMGGYYFDNITLEESASQNIIKNSSFDGLTNWIFHTDGVGYISNPSGKAFISLPTPGNNTQLYQSEIILTPNTDYKLSYFYNSGTFGNRIDVSIINHVSPYTVITTNIVSSITGGQIYTHLFRTGVSVPTNSRLLFVLYQIANYTFDDVTLEATSTPICSPVNCTLNIQ